MCLGVVLLGLGILTALDWRGSREWLVGMASRRKIARGAEASRPQEARFIAFGQSVLMIIVGTAWIAIGLNIII